MSDTATVSSVKKSPRKKAAKAPKPVICQPSNILTQCIYNKKGQRVGLFYAQADPKANMGFRCGFSKVNEKIVKGFKDIRIVAQSEEQATRLLKTGFSLENEGVCHASFGTFIKKVPYLTQVDKYDYTIGCKLAKKRMTQEFTAVAKEIKDNIMHCSSILNQYNYFLCRAIRYFHVD